MDVIKTSLIIAIAITAYYLLMQWPQESLNQISENYNNSNGMPINDSEYLQSKPDSSINDSPSLSTMSKISTAKEADIDEPEGAIFTIENEDIFLEVDATSGKIFIEGQDLLALKNKELIELRRNKMGMVFQSFALLPHKTVLENIAFPLQIKGIKTEDSISKAMDMVKLVGLEGRENYFPRELSGGQQQRVGIARSLAVEPDIWFLDEPFSALDPLIRKEMQDEFLRLQGVLKKTITFITHDFDEALRLADRIAIMKEGIIEQLDTPANIVLNPATDYVRKFTEEVPREKVLRIESVMDPVDASEEVSEFKAYKDAIIETVAEAVLTERKPVAVLDENDNVVGTLHASHVIKVLYGSHAEK